MANSGGVPNAHPVHVCGSHGPGSAQCAADVVTNVLGQPQASASAAVVIHNHQHSKFSPSNSMTVQSQSYSWRTTSTTCVGEDDRLAWSVTGSLAPGTSYTFTPQKPDCAGTLRALTANLSWSGSQLQLSSVVPAAAWTDGDTAQLNKSLVAPSVGSTGELCMFPAYPSTGSNTSYSLTVTNVGTTTASNVVVSGTDTNDWIEYYYSHCMTADGDHDGWNDATENSMAMLTYYVPNATPYGYMGTDYLRASGAAAPGTGTGADPADVNGDGVVDQTDVSLVQAQLGQGNGVPASAIGPNPTDPKYLYTQALPWRRYDLDGDGYVDQTDVNIVQKLVGQPIPMTTDIIPPTARITSLNGATVTAGSTPSVSRGSAVSVGLYGWDNASLTKVELDVNGTAVCTLTTPNSLIGGTPLFSCSWSVPKKSGVTYTLTAKAYDASGNVAASPATTVHS